MGHMEGKWQVCVGYIEFVGSLGFKDVPKPIRYVSVRSKKKRGGQQMRI